MLAVSQTIMAFIRFNRIDTTGDYKFNSTEKI